jgi:hypothetical protein
MIATKASAPCGYPAVLAQSLAHRGRVDLRSHKGELEVIFGSEWNGCHTDCFLTISLLTASEVSLDSVSFTHGPGGRNQ